MLWTIAMTGSGVAASLLLAGSVLATLGGRWRRALVVVAAAQLAGCLALALRGPEVRHVVWNGTLTIVVILALGLSAASLLAQRTGVSLGPLNHNDICHVLLTVALWPFYRIGLGLRDQGGPIGGVWPLILLEAERTSIRPQRTFR